MSALQPNVQLSNCLLYDITGNLNILNQAFHHHDNSQLCRALPWPNLSVSDESDAGSETHLPPFPGTFPFLVASGAAYDAAERRPHPRCHPGTRITTLTAINDWKPHAKSMLRRAC